MTHSPEVRVPLVDWTLWRRVASLVCAVPSMDKQRMARSPRVALPEPVLSRAKTGFAVPTRDWLTGREERKRYGERGLRGWARYAYDRAQ
jgi:asparagine synthase (glutamine-hydrolysing)